MDTFLFVMKIWAAFNVAFIVFLFLGRRRPTPSLDCLKGNR